MLQLHGGFLVFLAAASGLQDSHTPGVRWKRGDRRGGEKGRRVGRGEGWTNPNQNLMVWLQGGFPVVLAPVWEGQYS
jgi:hypothetical protein